MKLHIQQTIDELNGRITSLTSLRDQLCALCPGELLPSAVPPSRDEKPAATKPAKTKAPVAVKSTRGGRSMRVQVLSAVGKTPIKIKAVAAKLPDLTIKQVRDNLKDLARVGAISRVGCGTYQRAEGRARSPIAPPTPATPRTASAIEEEIAATCKLRDAANAKDQPELVRIHQENINLLESELEAINNK